MLHTGKEVVEKYSTDKAKITENTVRRWANNGLKHIRGRNGEYLYKYEWIDEYIELEAEKNIQRKFIEENLAKTKTKRKETILKCNFKEAKIV